MMAFLTLLFYLTTFLLRASAKCDAPSPAYLLPKFNVDDPGLKAVFDQISATIQETIAKDPKYDSTSFSVEVTSQQDTLFGFHRTAKIRSHFFDGGANPVDNATRYRIASMTKPFVVLGILQLQKAGHLSLDDPVLKYLPDLVDGQTGSLPWHDITLRALMSQQSGIPRDFAQSDFTNDPELRDLLGLPKLDREELKNLPTCDEMVNYTRSCNVTDFTNYIKTLRPLFAPNQHPSYSNINFNLLGLVISTVSNTSFESYITKHILHPLNMTQTAFTQPSNRHAAMSPTGGAESYWPFDMGIQNAAGGLYSSTADLSIWLRYFLSTYNGQTPAVNWFNPTSFSGSSQTFYGLPWEIYRIKAEDVMKGGSTRPLSLITKGGGLPGYSSVVIMIPDYAIGITILVVGDGSALSKIRATVVRAMVTYGERLALENLQSKYIGEYIDNHSNSRLVLASSPKNGLYVHTWISNGTDTLDGLRQRYTSTPGDSLLLRVTPTMLYVNETAQHGERWYVLPSVEREPGSDTLFGNECISDWETGAYAGKPVNEIVFWSDEGDEKVVEVGLPGFRVTLGRSDEGAGEEEQVVLNVQGDIVGRPWWWNWSFGLLREFAGW